MNMIKSFNQAIDYIETVLDKEIDEKKIFYLSGYSYPMFSRLFSILTGMTLSDYIRSRRLTEAAIELRESREKVVSLAIKYGYESSDSFVVAFKRFHGISSSQVRNGQAFKIISPIQLALNVQGGRNMDITIQKKASFFVAGINANDIDNSLCPSIWEKLYSSYSHKQLAQLGNGQSVGVCHDIENPDKINYMAGYIVTALDRAREAGLELLEVAETDYAVVRLKGVVPDCIHKGWKYVMEAFFPEHGYQHSGKPDFEYYYEGDMTSPDYEMELWVPVVRV